MRRRTAAGTRARSLRAALLLGLLCAPLGARAEDLLQVYRDAKRYDAQYAAARHSLEAGLEKLPQGRAALLPTLNLTASSQRTRIESDAKDRAAAPTLDFTRAFSTNSYTLTLTQPLYRRQNYLQYEQAIPQVRQAEATFAQAAQDLITRVTQAYFDVLAGQDVLAFVRAQKTAVSEQLAQAKRNFEVGTATITDTHEAQSRYDLILAQEIAAQTDLENRRRVLQQLTGKEYAVLRPLPAKLELSPPTPRDMQSWVGLAEKQAYGVQIQEAVSEIAQLEAKRASGAHHPTLDLVATYGQTDQTATALNPNGSDISLATVQLQLALPLYQGGALSSREREAAASFNKAQQDLEQARRTAALTSQQAFINVIAGQAQVKAYEQALVSSQSSLDSNKLGYQVGVRINIDVLNAQQQLYSTLRDLSIARYNTIMAQLRLKASVASLKEEDLETINQALARQ